MKRDRADGNSPLKALGEVYLLIRRFSLQKEIGVHHQAGKQRRKQVATGEAVAGLCGPAGPEPEPQVVS